MITVMMTWHNVVRAGTGKQCAPVGLVHLDLPGFVWAPPAPAKARIYNGQPARYMCMSTPRSAPNTPVIWIYLRVDLVFISSVGEPSGPLGDATAGGGTDALCQF